MKPSLFVCFYYIVMPIVVAFQLFGAATSFLDPHLAHGLLELVGYSLGFAYFGTNLFHNLKQDFS